MININTLNVLYNYEWATVRLSYCAIPVVKFNIRKLLECVMLGSHKAGQL